MSSVPNNVQKNAYSDDGRVKARIAVEEITQPHPAIRQQRSNVDAEDVLISTMAEPETSIHHQGINNQERYEEEAISERPDEAEDASSPPGTIGDRDIMSEHIQLHKYKKGKFHTGAGWEDDGVSEEAHKSTATKMSKAAEVSATIALQDTSRSIQNFANAYDRIQAEFQQKLVEAYSQMRHGYMAEYQENYN